MRITTSREGEKVVDAFVHMLGVGVTRATVLQLAIAASLRDAVTTMEAVPRTGNPYDLRVVMGQGRKGVVNPDITLALQALLSELHGQDLFAPGAESALARAIEYHIHRGLDELRARLERDASPWSVLAGMVGEGGAGRVRAEAAVPQARLLKALAEVGVAGVRLVGEPVAGPRWTRYALRLDSPVHLSRLKIGREKLAFVLGLQPSAVDVQLGDEPAQVQLDLLRPPSTWARAGLPELLPLGLAGLYFFDGELIRAFAAAREPTPEVRAAIATLLGLDLASQLDRDLGAVALRRQGELVRPDEIAAVEELERRLETLNEQIVGAEARHALISEQIAEARARLELSAEQAQPVTAQPVVSEAAARLADARGALVELAAGLLPLALVEELARDVLRLGRDEVEAAAEARLGQRLDARDAELYAILDACERGSSLAGSIRAWMERDREARVARRSTPALLGATATEVDALSRALGGALDAERARAADALEEARQAALAVRLARVRPDREDPAGAGGLAELVALAAELGRIEDARAKLLDERRRVEIEHRRRFKQLQEHRISEAEGRRVVAAADRVRQIMVVYQQELVRRRIDELEQLTTDRLRLLDRKEGRVGRVWLHPETFAMRLVDTTGQPIDRDRLSAGEQQILAVAFLWALADATGRDLPVVIDTPLARLDRVHRERLIVDFFPRVSHQLVLLSTNAEIDQDGRDLLARQGALSHCQTLAYNTRRGCTEVRDGYFEETS